MDSNCINLYCYNVCLCVCIMYTHTLSQAVDALPTSQTCFFQIRLPDYTSQEVLAEKLRYAIKHCRSIDMDNYMLRRGNDEYEEFDSDEEW